MSDRRLILSNIYICRLLNRILAEEKRREVLEANTNVHINNTVRKMQEVDANFEEMEGSSRRHCKVIDSLERKADCQAEFNRRMEAMMLDLQGTVEAQGDRIVELEEELAVLRSKKACKCGETVSGCRPAQPTPAFSSVPNSGCPPHSFHLMTFMTIRYLCL